MLREIRNGCARAGAPRAASPATTHCSRWRCCRSPPLLRWASPAWSPTGRRPGRPGERLAAALQELGPTFIKLGQSLSVRADLLGEAIAARPVASCRTGCRPSRRPRRKAHGRGRARAADRRAVRQLRRHAGRRRLDRPGAFRRHPRGRRGRGQGAAAGHRGGVRARPRLLLLAGRMGRARAARAAAVAAGRHGAAASRSRRGARWTCASRPRPPPSSARTAPTTRLSGAARSTGDRTASAC